MKKEEVEKFYANYEAPKGFTVPEGFPIARGKGVCIKREARSESEVFYAAGLIIPGNSRMNRHVGRIISIGPEVMWLQPGMKVIYNALADQSIMFHGNEYLTMSDIDVFYVLPEDASTLEANIKSEGRKQYNHDEMPDVEEKKEDIQEREEAEKELDEKIAKHESTTKFGYTGEGKDNTTEK